MGDSGKENGNYYNGLYRGYIGFNIGYMKGSKVGFAYTSDRHNENANVLQEPCIPASNRVIKTLASR